MSAPRPVVRRALAVIALMLVTGLVAAACGSDDDDSDDFARDPAAAADAALDAADAAFDASVTCRVPPVRFQASQESTLDSHQPGEPSRRPIA